MWPRYWEMKRLVCGADECTSGMPSGTGVVSTCSGATVGSTCVASCAPGFVLEGDLQVFVCSASGVLTGTDPICRADCGAFDSLGPEYVVAGSGFAHGASRTVSCARGYEATTGTTPTLLECSDGQWAPMALECAAYECGAFAELGAAYVVAGTGETYGSTRSLECAYGYTAQSGNPEALRCLEGCARARRIFLYCRN